MTQEDALKSCPFCGGDGEIDEHEGKTASGHYTANAYCNTCNLSMPNQQYGETKQEAYSNAASDWNTRAESASIRVALDALEDIEAHSKPPFSDARWLNYANDAARKALTEIRKLTTKQTEGK